MTYPVVLSFNCSSSVVVVDLFDATNIPRYIQTYMNIQTKYSKIYYGLNRVTLWRLYHATANLSNRMTKTQSFPTDPYTRATCTFWFTTMPYDSLFEERIQGEQIQNN